MFIHFFTYKVFWSKVVFGTYTHYTHLSKCSFFRLRLYKFQEKKINESMQNRIPNYLPFILLI
jgi:hypothetical protein